MADMSYNIRAEKYLGLYTLQWITLDRVEFTESAINLKYNSSKKTIWDVG